VKRIIGWLHVEPLLAVVLWGGIYPGVKLGLSDIPVLSFTYLRLLLAMAVLFLVSGSVQAFILRRPLWKPLLSAGLAQAVFQLFLIAGLQQTSAGNSAILLATASGRSKTLNCSPISPSTTSAAMSAPRATSASASIPRSSTTRSGGCSQQACR